MKATHAQANYRVGTLDKCCANCTMFTPPHNCSAIDNPVEKNMLCDYFKKRPGATNYGAMVDRARNAR